MSGFDPLLSWGRDALIAIANGEELDNSIAEYLLHFQDCHPKFCLSTSRDDLLAIAEKELHDFFEQFPGSLENDFPGKCFLESPEGKNKIYYLPDYSPNKKFIYYSRSRQSNGTIRWKLLGNYYGSYVSQRRYIGEYEMHFFSANDVQCSSILEQLEMSTVYYSCSRD